MIFRGQKCAWRRVFSHVRYSVRAVNRFQVFLLSPAFCGGRRAGYLLRPDSTLPLAQRLMRGTLTLGEAFSFMSGLYFRGKLAYAQHFGRQNACVLVITPTRGLMPPDAPVAVKLLKEFAGVDVLSGDARFRRPLDRDLKRLSRALPADARIVLLGSIASNKYVDAITAAFGERLHFPATFVGRGDMSRGGLMLRSVAANVELEYTPLVRDVVRHGPRPPKLEPLGRVGRVGQVGRVGDYADSGE